MKVRLKPTGWLYTVIQVVFCCTRGDHDWSRLQGPTRTVRVCYQCGKTEDIEWHLR